MEGKVWEDYRTSKKNIELATIAFNMEFRGAVWSRDTYLGVVSMETDPKSMGLNETTKEMSEDREELIPKALQIGKTRNGKG